MLKSLTVLFVALFALSVIAFSFHRHPDPGDHPSCVYCKLAKDISSSEHALNAPPDFPESSTAVFADVSQGEKPSFFVCLVNSRAPPA